MAFTPPFPHRHPVACSRLQLTLMTLDDWVLVNVTGPDSEKYLQSQLTADIAQMSDHQHLLAAHCDPKGKMWSNLHLFRCGEGFAFIERRSLSDVQLAEMKKYAVFSKVAFSKNDYAVLLGIAGFQARMALTNLFRELPNEGKQVVNDGDTTLLWFKYPAERFLLITDVATTERLIWALREEAQLNNSQQWLALNIEAGIPVIDSDHSGQFIPQATNMQALGGISFRKGCYTGQEMVARANFRGANKRAMWCLASYSRRIPATAGTNLDLKEGIELKIGQNWRRIGTVLAAVQLDDGRLLLQVVMNKDMKRNSVFRIYNDATTLLRIEPLPYSLENHDQLLR